VRLRHLDKYVQEIEKLFKEEGGALGQPRFAYLKNHKKSMFHSALSAKAYKVCPVYPKGFAELDDELDTQMYKVEIDDEETGGKREIAIESRYLDWSFSDEHERKQAAEMAKKCKKKKLCVQHNLAVDVQDKTKLGRAQVEQGVLVAPFRFKRNSELIKSEQYTVKFAKSGVQVRDGKDLQPLGWNLHGPDEIVKVVLVFPRESKHPLAPLAGEIGVLLTGSADSGNFYPSSFEPECEYNVELEGVTVNEPGEEKEDVLLRCPGFALQNGQWKKNEMELDFIPGGTVWEKEGWVDPKKNHCVLVQVDENTPTPNKGTTPKEVKDFINRHLDKFGAYERENNPHNGQDCYKRTTATAAYFLYWADSRWCIGDTLKVRDSQSGSGVFATCKPGQPDKENLAAMSEKYIWEVKSDAVRPNEINLTITSTVKLNKGTPDKFWKSEDNVSIRDLGWRFNEGTGNEVGPTSFPFQGGNIACGEARSDGKFSQRTTLQGGCEATFEPVLDEAENYHKDLVQRVAKADWMQTTKGRLDPLKRLRHLKAEQDWDDEQKKDKKKLFSKNSKWRDQYKKDKFFTDLELAPENIVAKKDYDPEVDGFDREKSYHAPRIGLTNATMSNHKMGLKQVLLSRQNARAAQNAANGAALHAMNLKPVRAVIAAQMAAAVAMEASRRGGQSEEQSRRAEEQSREMAKFHEARELEMDGAKSECSWVSTCFGNQWNTVKMGTGKKSSDPVDYSKLGTTGHPSSDKTDEHTVATFEGGPKPDKTYYLGEFTCISLRNLRNKIVKSDDGEGNHDSKEVDFCDDGDISVSLDFNTKKMEELVADDSYSDATFLASSLFNCLELPNPNSPEIYVPDFDPSTKNYALDPACSIACAPATWYRTFEYKPPCWKDRIAEEIADKTHSRDSGYKHQEKPECGFCNNCDECKDELVQSEVAVWKESDETKWFLGGQNYRHQIFNARLMLEKIYSKMSSDRGHFDYMYSYQNGFLFVNDEMLREVRAKLGASDDDDEKIIKRSDLTANERGNIMDELMVGVHWDAQATSNSGVPFEYEAYDSKANKKRRRGLVYAAACPVDYSTKRLGVDWEHPYPSTQKETWKSFACMVLEASYEACMLAAVHRMMRNKKGSTKVVISHLGGKAFGNDQDWVFTAINRAIQRTKALLHQHKPLIKKLQSHITLKQGDQVRAKQRDGKYYRGTVHYVHDPPTAENKVDIAFETVLNDEERVHKSLLKREKGKSGAFQHGERVKVRATNPLTGRPGDHYCDGAIAATTSRDNLSEGTSLNIDYYRVQKDESDYEDLQHWVSVRGVNSEDCKRYRGKDDKPFVKNEEVVFHDLLFHGELFSSSLLLFSSSPLLLFSSSPLLLFSSSPLLLFSSPPLLLFSSSPLLLFSSPPLLLSSSPPLLLSKHKH
jgi:hypothetical protein